MIRFSGALALLDIEGTVAPLAYVHEVLFPYARTQVSSFLERRWSDPVVLEAVHRLRVEAGAAESTAATPWEISAIVTLVNGLMDRDAKQTGLKQLQGLIWEEGFAGGGLKSEIFPDVTRALAAWFAQGKQARIFSSGSVHAQQLFFRHTAEGDLGRYLAGHYDTTTGPKRAAASYAAIAKASGVAPGEILYLSDVTAELDAAREAGCATALVLRPGNAPSPPHTHPQIRSFDEIAIA